MTAAGILLDKWSRAHTSFHEVEGLFPSQSGRHDETLSQAIATSPNGELFRHSSFLNNLTDGRRLVLGHLTFRLDDIRKSGSLYASGGCLVGSPYFFPMTPVEGGYRLHNLGEYIYRAETAGKATRSAELLMLDVNLTNHSHADLQGLNYLKLGDVHFDLFEQLSYLLSPRETFELRHAVEGRVARSRPFLRLCAEAVMSEAVVPPVAFFRTLNETVPHLPVLGYAYFEALSEYLMLYSDADETVKYRERGEFNNFLYKRLVFGLYPGNRENFQLCNFNPTLTDLAAHLARQGCFRKLDMAALAAYVTRRLIGMMGEIAFARGGQEKFLTNREWSFSDLRETLRPLLGHLVHRELRSFGRYPDFYFYYDQMKALQAWNFWNHQGIVVPFNGTFPKGEVGLNPANPDLTFTAHRCRIEERMGDLIAVPEEDLALSLAPRLVDLKHTLMRNKAVSA